MDAIIMAGGKGTRLEPLTNALPKPLLPICHKPLLEVMIRALKAHGITDVTVTLGHKAESIRNYLRDGPSLGVNLKYFNEERPLGTAGSLALLSLKEGPFIVTVGDIVTDVDYSRLLKFHSQEGAIGTMVICEKSINIPYGVLGIEKGPSNEIISFSEKPKISFPIYTGIVVLEGRAVSYIQKDERIDMVELFDRMKSEGERIVAYNHDGQWFDIGQTMQEYLMLNDDILSGKVSFSSPYSDILRGGISLGD